MGASSSKKGESDEEEEELTHVDTGDSLKVKQVLDEAVVKGVLDKGYEEVHRIENLKVILMVIACLFAMTAQFYPMPFPKSRPLLGVCCSGYFIFSGILQLTIKFVERDAVLVTKPKDGPGLRVSTTFPRYQADYTIKIQHDASRDITGPELEHKFNVGNFFDADGYLYEDGVILAVSDLIDRFEAKKSD
eukprot:CAMPEP_0197395136 /NCGR_PEP_ID=MMETSP1165-20131217/6355_1 /TAXON_ID=284809 /ORGANISM="Chrysocystis fragilis, Strain CCMP3189" /LENGTH=189 /DNA_ID=CAMNT_0042920887 /DNA_START=21 /DNA_END=590 /DNA_ORIENTATION=-